MNFEEIQKDLEKHLSHARYIHVLGVVSEAEKLALQYGADPEKARMAALVHDCAKELPLPDMQKLVHSRGWYPEDYVMNNGSLLHGPAGSALAAKKYGIQDSDILMAVYYHTTGRPGMAQLEKIIFLADYIEPSRHFPGVEEIRNEAYKNLDQGVLKGYESTISHLLSQHQYIYEMTFKGYNDMILSSAKRKSE